MLSAISSSILAVVLASLRAPSVKVVSRAHFQHALNPPFLAKLSRQIISFAATIQTTPLIPIRGREDYKQKTYKLSPAAVMQS
jgi:hypothetical protein